MSGHSKWSTIKRQKGAADIKRGQIFTKLANAITIAVRQGGGITDPTSNFRLRLAIDAAHAQNMPKENIERAIERALRLAQGKQEGELQELVYEGFAGEGISVVVEAATDNPTRTTTEIKNLFQRSGASFGQPGSSSYLFQKMGAVYVAKDNRTFDEIFQAALDAGAQDLEESSGEVVVYTQTSDLGRVRDKLLEKGLQITDADYMLKPITKVRVEDKEKYEKIVGFLSSLEQIDEVQRVYSNLETV